MVLVTAGFFIFAVTFAIKARRRKVVSGREGLVGLMGTARTALSPQGKVFVAGEHWAAVTVTGESVPEGTEIEVVAVENLKLTVKPQAPR